MAKHTFTARVKWTGNTGAGTASYTAYSRDHEISGEGKAAISGSSAPAYRGDATRYNPEELLIASLSSCHMLWVLHLCSEAGIIVDGYEDEAEGELAVEGGAGRFASVTLHPRLRISGGADSAVVEAIHERAHKLCFIANSVNFPVRCDPCIEAGD
jgi:organic hydroperoxide reductase OsmC/OhrA